MTRSATYPFALWLVPAPGALGGLADHLRTACARLGTPAFPPHVTAYAGRTADLDVAAKVLAGLASPGRLTLRVEGIHGEAVWSRAYFVRFAPDPGLSDLSAAAHAAFAGPDPYVLDPHLSLAYRGGLTDAERAALEADRPALPATVDFDRLALVAPGPEGWPAISGWRRLAERAL